MAYYTKMSLNENKMEYSFLDQLKQNMTFKIISLAYLVKIYYLRNNLEHVIRFRCKI